MAKTCYSCAQVNVDSLKRCFDCGQPLPPISDNGQRPSLDVSRFEIPAEGIKLLERLGQESRIRIYVETGSNKGHQSASVTLARKLIQRFKTRNPKLVLEFLCNDEDAASKARSIIGGKTLDKVAVEVTTFGRWFSPSRVNFAFSGAVDAPEVTFRRLNSQCFIGLQPYGWAGGAEVSMTGDKQVILAKACKLMAAPVTTQISFPVSFNRLPFTESDASSNDWVPQKAPDLTVKKILDYARGSLRLKSPRPHQGPRVYVCPIYGMGKGQPMEELGAKVWTNVGTALARIARTKGLPGGVLLLNLSKDTGSNPQVWRAVKQHFASDALVKVLDNPISFDDVDDIFEEFEKGLKLCICTVGGDKDQLTMDRAYRECPLPPIFEGQGSLTQVLSMGRPFIKYSSRAAVDAAWTSDYLPVPGYDNAVVSMQKLCNAIGETLDFKKPISPDDLCGLFLQMVDPDSLLSSYFRECRKMAVDTRFDRLAWAAEALTRMNSHGIGTLIPKPK
ncbi:hypothetical protein [Cystobacter fuscus]|uniref:hypothetical protein n=1 Tax=Cystobacter fuscus TaxID=43 RepID=UPI002B318193|nr:hypothetical protein F0U63_22060 [Cystobacter fuscus]